MIRKAPIRKINTLTRSVEFKVSPQNDENLGFIFRTFASVKGIDVYAVDMDAAQILQFAFIGKVPIDEVKRSFLIDYVYHNMEETDDGDPMRNIYLKKNHWEFYEMPSTQEEELEEVLEDSNTEDNE